MLKAFSRDRYVALVFCRKPSQSETILLPALVVEQWSARTCVIRCRFRRFGAVGCESVGDILKASDLYQ